MESLLAKADVTNARTTNALREWHRVRSATPAVAHGRGHHHGGGALPFLDPVPELAALLAEQARRFARGLLLWPRDRVELAGFGGEMDRIACFGMATSTGIIMLAYLRQALANAGGLESLTPIQLREVVLNGAAQRLRPKLLTETTTLLALAPLLLATGTGSEVLRPMVVPVLGGLLIADEVIDLFLPELFYPVRLRRLRASHTFSRP